MTSACVLSILPSFDRSSIPRPYGLIKVHKRDNPVRVITPTCGSMFYQLARKLDLLLKPSIERLKYRITCISDFICELRVLPICASSFMVSIDAVSLFDNVDTVSFMRMLPDFLSETEREWRNSCTFFRNASVTTIVNLFRCVLDNSVLSFNNMLLLQKRGCPMGSPVSVSVSDLYLGYYEELFLETYCPEYLRPVLYRRYVDDVLLIFNFRVPYSSVHSMVDAFVCEFHNFLSETSIRFTVQFESVNNCLPFLDCLITRYVDKLETAVYRKPTHSNRYISKYSFIPTQFLYATLNTLKMRALRYCTNPHTLKVEFDFLYDIFVNKHGYAKNVVCKYFDTDFMLSTCSNVPVLSTHSSNRIVLPYGGPLSLVLRRVLLSAGYLVSFRSCFNLRQVLFYCVDNDKNSDPMSRSNVVYLLSCDDCSTFYCGMTTRSFNVRYKDHKNDVTSRASVNKISAISAHARNNKHTFSFCKFLASDSLYYRLRFKEACFITANADNANICNIQCTDTSSLVPAVYNSLLSKLCKI